MKFCTALSGSRPQRPEVDEHPNHSGTRTIGRVSAGFVADAGAEDEEHPTRGMLTAPLVQTKLTMLVDRRILRGIEEVLEKADAQTDLRRHSVASTEKKRPKNSQLAKYSIG